MGRVPRRSRTARTRRSARGAAAPAAARGTGDDDPERRLLALLHRGGPALSGAALGRELGMSRTAVWKRVAKLRQQGYAIEGTPSQGYRLVNAPDRLTPAEIHPHLRSRLLGRALHYEEQTESTNLWARELARAGAVEGTTVVADSQTGGRGRLGRSWFSPPGVNLYASVILRPALPPARAPQLSLIAGSAVAATIEALTGARPALKWPNDVLLSGGKVAGLLTEMDSEADRVAFVIVGIGVNLNVSAREIAGALGQKATSVAAVTGQPVRRAAFAGRLLGELEERYRRYVLDGFEALRREWESYSCLTGCTVTVAGPDGRAGRALRGCVTGIDVEGALCLRAEDGRAIRVLAGDVTLAGAYRDRPGRRGGR